MLIVDTDADGDQILAADDEKDGIFRITTNPPERHRQQRQPDIESATCGSGAPPTTHTSDKCHISSTSSKYPGIPANGSFDTADTEECATLDGSEASTDDGEINSRPSAGGGEGDSYEDDEERVQDATSSSQLGAKDIILQRLQIAREKLNDMINWYTFVGLSFLTAVAAILCVAFGNHGVAAILLFVAVLLITVLICWLRLDLRAVEMM